MTDMRLTVEQGGSEVQAALHVYGAPDTCLLLECDAELAVGMASRLVVELDGHSFEIHGRIISHIAKVGLGYMSTFQVDQACFMQARMLLQLVTISQYRAQFKAREGVENCESAAFEWVQQNAASFSCSFDHG